MQRLQYVQGSLSVMMISAHQSKDCWPRTGAPAVQQTLCRSNSCSRVVETGAGSRQAPDSCDKIVCLLLARVPSEVRLWWYVRSYPFSGGASNSSPSNTVADRVTKDITLPDRGSLDGAMVLNVAQPGARETGAAADVDALQDGKALQQRGQLRIAYGAGGTQVRQHPPTDCVVELWPGVKQCISPRCKSERGRSMGMLLTAATDKWCLLNVRVEHEL